MGGERTRDPRTTFAYYTWWKGHMLPRFEQDRLEPTVVAVGSSGEEEDYDSDHSHPRRRRPKCKQQIGTPSENKKKAPLATLNDASASKKKPHVEAQPASHTSPPTFIPPILETEPPHSALPQTSCPQTSCPPVLEMEPPKPKTPAETVQILSSPEPDPPASSTTTIQTLLLGTSEVSREEVAPPEAEAIVQIGSMVVVAPEGIEVAEAPATNSSMRPILEVAPALTQFEALPPVREVMPVIQEVVTPLPLPAPPVHASAATPFVTPLQQLRSDFGGVVLQFWKDRIVPRMLSLDVVNDSSLSTDAEEDAHERLELAGEQAQSAYAKVVYLATQVEQIRESVREVKEAVLEATRKVDEILTLPTLSAAKEANLLSLRAAFAESQQELAKDL
ncbi:hypothetical protein H6P81_016218 [Aristolochia fimbriata]|uniref:Uncharacterized protein n=1 Tax=Aristolochia fimbriata TaxID=158543 RepID=A0AAV7E7S9_ARIFI|nr:hypothetical protein H6P81_016218 [Aristolochia fimbriata]